MEVEGGTKRKGVVALYEAIGTAILVFAIIVSTGNAYAVTLSLLIAIVMCGPITGAHFNPAVTFGVYF